MLNVTIPTDHPDAGNPLLLVATHALARMGARVEIAAGGENLVRALSAHDPLARDAPGDGGATETACALVQAEGLPNLMHELVHAVQAGRLDDDHGIDYGAIPFDLDAVEGRAVLWNELACCVISCAYLTRHGRAARAGRDPDAVAREVDDWFVEQVEIQPVFYGMEGRPHAFAGRVGALLQTHRDEAHEVVDRAYAATEQALADAGAEPPLAAAPTRPPLPALWARLCPRDDVKVHA